MANPESARLISQRRSPAASHDVRTQRTVTIGGATDTLSASFDAPVFAGRLETGYRFQTALFGLRPYAALQVLNVELPAYRESGAPGLGAAAMAHSAGQSSTGTPVRNLVRMGRTNHRHFKRIAAGARAAWVHDFDRNSSISATFEQIPGASFVINGARVAQDSALLTGMLGISMSRNVTVLAKVDGELGNGTRTVAGTGTLRYVW